MVSVPGCKCGLIMIVVETIEKGTSRARGPRIYLERRERIEESAETPKVQSATCCRSRSSSRSTGQDERVEETMQKDRLQHEDCERNQKRRNAPLSAKCDTQSKHTRCR